MRFPGISLASKALAILALASATALATVPETDPLSDWIIDGDFAYGLMQPEAAAPSGAEEVTWSGDGSSLITVRSDRKQDADLPEARVGPPTVVTVWNRRSGKSRDVYKTSGDAPVFVAPLGSFSSVVLAGEAGTFLMETGSGRLVRLAGPGATYRFPDTHPALGAPRFLLFFQGVSPDSAPGTGSPSAFARVYDMNGAVLAAGSVTPNLMGPKWSPDGWPVFRTRRSRQSTAPAETYILRPDGMFKYEGPAVDYAEPTDPAIHLQEVETQIGESTQIHSLWLQSAEKSELPKALVASDVSWRFALSPTNDAVAYISRGVPMVRRILKMPKGEFLELLMAAKKRRTMSFAKQAVTAIMIYGADADDALPLNGSFADAIQPYMKNAEIARQFTYTFGGGLIPKDADPSKFELGYVQGDGGRAVAYGDGHVVWVPDPKP